MTTVADAEADLGRVLEAGGVELADAAMVDVVEVVVDWYERQRFDDVDVDTDGDMVLFQWGPVAGLPGLVDVDVTRQFVVGDDLWQLSISSVMPWGEASESVERGSVWCHRPIEVESFRSQVAGSAVIRHVGHRRGPADVRFGAV